MKVQNDAKIDLTWPHKLIYNQFGIIQNLQRSPISQTNNKDRTFFLEAQYSWAALVLTKIRIKWIFKRYFTSLFEQVVQPPRYELFYTLTNCKRSCLSSHLHRCKKRISPILCFWNCSISHIPSFLQTFYVDSIHVDFDMKWCSKSIHENALQYSCEFLYIHIS